MQPEKARELLNARLDELQHLGPGTHHPAFAAWRRKTDQTLRAVLGDTGILVTDFNDITWIRPRARMSSVDDGRIARAEAVDFKEGMAEAMGVLEAALYEVEVLACAEQSAEETMYDAELWDHVSHLVEQEEWGQVPSQTAVFIEDRVRKWAGLADDVHGKELWTKVLHYENGVFPLGRVPAEKQGWFQLGMGFTLALRNASTHRIETRPDAKRYALGVLGTASLLLTQLRYEHGNRFVDADPLQ